MPQSKKTKPHPGANGVLNGEVLTHEGAAPHTFFKKGILVVRGYRFDTPLTWGDPGSARLIAEGVKLEGHTEIPVVARIGDAAGLERDAHILSRLAKSPDGAPRTLRTLDIITIPPVDGGVKVLIVKHPGDNALSQYYSMSYRKLFLLPGSKADRMKAAKEDVPEEVEEADGIKDSVVKLPPVPTVIVDGHEPDEFEARIIDISSFLHFALQAAQCVELMHAASIVHGDVRPSSFHWQEADDIVRFAHFNQRTIHLDSYGGSSSLVLEASRFSAEDQELIKEILCYMAPEQTGHAPGISDHRSDLYGLGASFWRLLVGRRMFSGSTIRGVLAEVVSKEPPLLHTVRADIPNIISRIIHKLLAKNPEDRYASASGLKEDLLECNRNLGQGWASEGGTVELISDFPLGRYDRYSVFHIGSELFGRENEAKVIQRCIKEFASRFKRAIRVTSTRSGSISGHSGSDARSSTSTPSIRSGGGEGAFELAAVSSTSSETSTQDNAVSLRPVRRVTDDAGTRALVVRGPAGSGKSSLVLRECLQDVRGNALFGQAKFDPGDPTPYSAILECLSAIFRQFLTLSNAEIFSFGETLRERLGPQMTNITLLYAVVPEIEHLVRKVWANNFAGPVAIDALGTAEARTRFENLMVDILAELSSSRMIILFLDDLQNADASSLSLIEAFARARVNVLILGTLRSSHHSVADRLANILGTRLIFISLQPLSEKAFMELVTRTLHIDAAHAAPLVSALVKHSRGNVFTARSLLMLLRNEDYIVFHWASNSWTFDPDLVEDFLEARSRMDPDNVDATFVVQHLREMPVSTQRFLSVAAAIGPTFDIKLVSAYMEALEISDGESSDDGSIAKKLTHSWVSGLQSAMSETMVANRGRDMYTFSHDRYREASLALAQSQPGGLAAISAKLVDMLLEEGQPEKDEYRISDYILRCIPVLLEHPNRGIYVQTLVSAGSQAFSRGALESALLYYDAAYSLLGANHETAQYPETSPIILKFAELLNWKGDFDRSDLLLAAMTNLPPAEKVMMLQTKSRNLFSRRQLAAGMECLLDGLRELGVDLKGEYSEDEAKTRHLAIRQDILDAGLEHIKDMPVAENETCNLRSTLLSEVYLFAYFTNPSLARMIAYEAISLALQFGLSPNNGLAFISYACASVELDDFSMGVQVGRLALELSLRLSTSVEKARVLLFYVSLLAPSDSVHFMQTWSLSMQGYKFARAGGDPLFSGFGYVHLIANRFFTSQPMPEIIAYAEEILLDLNYLRPGSETLCFVNAFKMTCRALAGLTYAVTPETIFDADDWDDKAYVEMIKQNPDAVDSTLNWYHSFRLCALYSLGFFQAAVDLSSFTAATQHHHPGHRHRQLANFYTGLALCATVREGIETDVDERMTNAKDCLAQLAVFMKFAEINVGAWYHLLSAEIASTEGSPEAVVMYDRAIAAAEKGQWLVESGWASFLAGSHLDRLGAPVMARNFWQQGLQKFKSLGATGIINYLVTIAGPHLPLQSFASTGGTQEAGVQTDSTDTSTGEGPAGYFDAHQMTPLAELHEAEDSLERMIQHLPSKDLASLINSLQAITTDVNLSSSLERLTALMMETTAITAEEAVIVVRDDDHSDFRIYTHQQGNNACATFEPALPLESPNLPPDIVILPIVQHVLHSGETLHVHRVSADPRFRSAGSPSEGGTSSVLALPVRSRGITLGALYIASSQHNAFSERDMLVLNLLATQAAVVISNGFLFASLRKSTQANLRAISEQRTALEAARKSQEEALQATRVKSIFLANMSHEMRTPFASFYGLLGLLAETNLDAEQLELVGTARQSCELLLETISALLDFSKLEAHAVKLNLAPVSPADLVADCQELLLTLATQKGLELTYDVDADVPASVDADGPRIRQVLQNLIGNALKFTPKGMVDTRISIDQTKTVKAASKEIVLRIEVTDSGIGMSKSDLSHLFKPFSQVDQSATKRFGGTGLGLSICRELLTLMGGKISVTSEVGVGSSFICQIPVGISFEPSSRLVKQLDELATLRQALSEPQPANVLAYSPFPSTQSLLKTGLQGMRANVVTSLSEVTMLLSVHKDMPTPTAASPSTELTTPEVVVLDASHAEVEEIAAIIADIAVLRATRIVHLFVRTAETLHRAMAADDSQPRRALLRCAKPVRPLPLLRLLAQARAEARLPPPPLPPPPPPPPSATPSILINAVNYAQAGGQERPSAAGQIRKAISAPAVPKKGGATPKLVDHFSAEQLEHFKSIHILIAEDNPVAQKLLSRQLHNLGFIVTATSHGAEAIERWEARPPGSFKVALFDHHMPVCDGLTAARRIRELEGQRGIKGDDVLPIISLTADAQSQAKEDCLNAGMQLYLTKPLRPDDLLRLVWRFVLKQEDLPSSPRLTS